MMHGQKKLQKTVIGASRWFFCITLPKFCFIYIIQVHFIKTDFRFYQKTCLSETDPRIGVLWIFLVSLPIERVQQEDDSFTLNGDVSTQLHDPFILVMFEVKFSSVLLKALDYRWAGVNILESLSRFVSNNMFVFPFSMMSVMFSVWATSSTASWGVDNHTKVKTESISTQALLAWKLNMLTLGYVLGINNKTLRYTQIHRYTECSNYVIMNILLQGSLPCPIQC